MSEVWGWLGLVAMVLALVAFFVVAVRWQDAEHRKCDQRDGVLVREYPIGFKCVAGPAR